MASGSPQGPAPSQHGITEGIKRATKLMGVTMLPLLNLLSPGAAPAAHAIAPRGDMAIMRTVLVADEATPAADDMVIQQGDEEAARQRGKIMMEAQRDATPGRPGRLMGLVQPVESLSGEGEAIFRVGSQGGPDDHGRW